MDVMCVAGQCLRLTQKEVQRSPLLTRLEADGPSGAVPLPFLMRFLSLWKHHVVNQGLSADDLISVIEVRVSACQKLSHFLTHHLCRACTVFRFREIAIHTKIGKVVIFSCCRWLTSWSQL
jgi:hypothetical protein